MNNIARYKAYLVGMLVFFGAETHAFPTRPFSLGLGVGVPEFAFLEAQVVAFVRCQIGASAGGIPITGILPGNIPLPEREITLVTGDVFIYEPKVTPTFYLISPFIRIFPTPSNNFYLQFMWSMVKVTANIAGDMNPRDNHSLPVVPVTGRITITQHLPTVSVGYFFSSQIYYFNLNVGISGMLKPTTSTTLSAAVPDSLGGTVSNEMQLNTVNADVQSSVVDATNEVRATYGIFPSIHLSVGFYL